MFLVPKKEGTYRPVIRLSSVNLFVNNSHFQMEGLHCLKTLSEKGSTRQVSISGLPIFPVPIQKSFKRFLSFIWGTKHYIPGSPFWSKFSTSNLHQTTQASSHVPEEAWVSNNNFPRHLSPPRRKPCISLK